MATTGLSASAVCSSGCHNLEFMGLQKLMDCANSVWEICTCLVPHHDSTESDNNNVNIWLMLS